MGLGKKLDLCRSSFDSLVSGSVGWQPPEVLRKSETGNYNASTASTSFRLTKAVDIFSAGCVVHYVLTNGIHPFGDPVEREYRILLGKMDLRHIGNQAEACDLISSMCCSDPSLRISADDAVSHPFFWTDEVKLQFLSDVSDRIEVEDEYSLVRLTFEYNAKHIVGNAWNERLHSGLIDNLGKYRKYHFGSVRDCMRVIRNKRNHYRELPIELQHELGDIPTGFLNYFCTRFPRLLLYVYAVTSCFAIDTCDLPYIMTNQKPIPTSSPPQNWERADVNGISSSTKNSMDEKDTVTSSSTSPISLSTPLRQIDGLLLNASFKHYYQNISLKRLIHLQQISKLHYRTYSLSEHDWINGIPHSAAVV
jgi:serine/threonine protein kinase